MLLFRPYLSGAVPSLFSAVIFWRANWDEAGFYTYSFIFLRQQQLNDGVTFFSIDSGNDVVESPHTEQNAFISPYCVIIMSFGAVMISATPMTCSTYAYHRIIGGAADSGGIFLRVPSLSLSLSRLLSRRFPKRIEKKRLPSPPSSLKGFYFCDMYFVRFFKRARSVFHRSPTRYIG